MGINGLKEKKSQKKTEWYVAVAVLI
jgi:hypothetical protein